MVSPFPPPDHWLNVVTGVGAIAATLGVAGGAILTFLYGRRGSASVSAVVHDTPYGFIIAARPLVKAVGLFRVTFHKENGVVVRLTEVKVLEDGELGQGESWQHTKTFDQEYADPGEELTTTITFTPTKPEARVVGWLVYLQVRAPARFERLRTSRWADQIFLPRVTEAEEVS